MQDELFDFYCYNILIEYFQRKIWLLTKVLKNVIFVGSNKLDFLGLCYFDGVVILFFLRCRPFDRFAVGIVLASRVGERLQRIASRFCLGTISFVETRLEWLGVVDPVLDQHRLLEELMRFRVINDDCVTPRFYKVHVHECHTFLWPL